MYCLVMSPTELRRVMDKLNLSIVDVAAGTKLHPHTIEKFLKGRRRVNKSTLLLLEQFVLTKISDPERKAAIE